MTYPKKYPADRKALDKHGKLLGILKDGRTDKEGWLATLEDNKLVESLDEGRTWEYYHVTQEPSTFALMVVVQEQPLEDKNHWALYVGKLGKAGRLYQVKGDPTIEMNPKYAEHIDIFNSNTFMPDKSFTLNYEVTSRQRDLVHQVWQHFTDPKNQLIPQKVNPGKVDRNCQTFVIDMLKELHEKDRTLVTGDMLHTARTQREKFPWEPSSRDRSRSPADHDESGKKRSGSHDKGKGPESHERHHGKSHAGHKQGSR